MRIYTFFILFLLLATPPALAQLAMSKHDMALPVEITSDSLEIIKDANTALFSGSVEILQGKLQLLANTVTVHYQPQTKNSSKDAQSRIKKILADGNVILNTGTEKASAAQGIYDVDGQTITLLRNVILQKDKNMVSGSKLVYNLLTGKSQLIEETPPLPGSTRKRVKGVFIPEKK